MLFSVYVLEYDSYVFSDVNNIKYVWLGRTLSHKITCCWKVNPDNFQRKVAIPPMSFSLVVRNAVDIFVLWCHLVEHRAVFQVAKSVTAIADKIAMLGVPSFWKCSNCKVSQWSSVKLYGKEDQWHKHKLLKFPAFVAEVAIDGSRWRLNGVSESGLRTIKKIFLVERWQR